MLYGAQYYRPPFPERGSWQRDILNMKSLGFNCIKLWAVWNWIEKTRGSFDFSELDELVELAKSNQLKIIINVIPEGAPYWTYEGNKEDLYTTADGQVVEYGGPANLPSGGWPGLCMDHPEFARLTANFIEKTARHYAEEAAVIAIDVWNEPHLEPMYDYRNNMLCYCRHSKQAFLNWLQDKYGTLEDLNKAWYRTYEDWSQVTPPTRFGTWADMLDWRKFWLQNLQRWLRIRVEACRRGAPNIKVETHVAYSGILGNRITGGLANELGDEFLLAKEVDWFGLSSFPKWLMGKQHIYRHLIHNEMIAEASHGKTFFQVELQGGAGKPGLLGGEVPDARDITLWNWNTVAAGGKGSVYWQYAPEPAGIESPGFGLTGFLGENTERSLAAGDAAKHLNQPFLDEAKRVSLFNGIYVSRHSDLLCFAADRKEELYAGSLSGVFNAAYQAGIPVRFYHEDYIDELLESGIRTLYLPMTLIISEKERHVFRQFVEQGGTLVSEACPGLYQQDGLLEQQGNALHNLFGVHHKEIQGMPDWGPVSAVMEDGSGSFTGQLYRQLIIPEESVTVLARFEDAEPAITQYSLGKGKAVWIGTYCGYHYEKTLDADTGNLLIRWFRQNGYGLIKKIHMSQSQEKDIPLAPVVRLLETETEYVLVVINHTYQNADIKITFEEEQKIKDRGYQQKMLNISMKPSTGTLYHWKKD